MWNQKAFERGNSRSVIRELFAYGQKIKAERGEEAVCDFSLGNPATPPPEEVLAAFRTFSASDDPMALHGYTAAEGDLGVRRTLAERDARRTGEPLTAEHYFLTAGAAPALTAVCYALTVLAGDEFIAPAPFFPEYAVFSSVAGGVFRTLPARLPDLGIDAETLGEMITPATRGVFINSPNNPSGVVYTRENLLEVAAVLTEKSREVGHPIYLICDEPYRELVYDGAEVPYLPAIYPATVVCYSYSKSYSLPGDRIGYVLVPPTCPEHEKLRAAIAGAARTLGHVCAPALLQYVVAAAEAKPDLAFYDANRRTLYDALTSYGYECVFPAGAFYLLCRAPGGDAKVFSEEAKSREGILVVPCDGFGLPGYVRIAYCVAPSVIARSLPGFERLASLYRSRGISIK